MTDDNLEQFFDRLEDKRNKNIKELVEFLVPVQKDRELLIRMDETQKNLMLMIQNNRTEDLLKIATAKTTAEAAHRRIDSLSSKGFWANVITIGGMILTALFVYLKN